MAANQQMSEEYGMTRLSLERWECAVFSLKCGEERIAGTLRPSNIAHRLENLFLVRVPPEHTLLTSRSIIEGSIPPA
ncbi:hypothetical protein ccbrp13_33130 [Ktedonobacteria bacterium brp13]|nr:hypothetical protein ccbrp13_33130 [Ktedonobacteria bacterium brp13]